MNALGRPLSAAIARAVRSARSAARGALASFLAAEFNTTVQTAGGLGTSVVSNGDFANGTTGYTSSNATIAVVSGELEVTATAAAGRAEQTLTLVAGQEYEVTGTMRRGTATGVRVNFIRGAAGSYASFTGTGYQTGTGNIAVNFRFTAPATDAAIQLQANSTGTAYFDNIAVRPVTPATSSVVKGVWFDPNDFARYMAAKGPELVTTAWATPAGYGNTTTSSTTGTVVLTAAGANDSRSYLNLTTTPQKTYFVTVRQTAATGTITSAILYARDGLNGTGTIIGQGNLNNGGGVTFTFVSNGTNTNLLFALTGTTPGGTFSEISVRELTDINSCTLFQDAAGTTPVTAVEQPVGLILDKSKGLVRGVERFNDASVTFGAGASRVSSGVYRVYSATGTETADVLQLGAMEAGKWYEIALTVDSITTLGGGVRVGDSGAGAVFTSTGPKRTILLAGASAQIAKRVSGVTDIQISNVSVKELPGNHASQSTAASRPVLTARKNLYTSDTQDLTNAAWTKRNGVTIGANAIAAPDGTLTADKMIEPTGTAVKEISTQGHAAVAGSPVTFSVHAKAGERSRIRLAFNSTYFAGGNSDIFDLSSGTIVSTGASTTSSMVSLGNGWYRCSVTQTAHTSVSGGTALNFITLVDGANSAAYTGDGLSGVYLWGLQAEAGSAATRYQRVTTATDYDWQGFPLSLKFDGVDDWLQTGNIDFTGTDKMTVVAGVTKLSDAVIGVVCELSTDPNNNAGTFGLMAPRVMATGDKDYGFRSRGAAALQEVVVPTVPAPHTTVLCGIANIGGDSVSIRSNGALTNTSTTDQGTGNYGNHPLYIGRRGGTSLPFNGQLYGLAIIGKLLADVGPAEREIGKNTPATLAAPVVPSTPTGTYTQTRVTIVATHGAPSQIATIGVRATAGGANVSATAVASSEAGAATTASRVVDADATTWHEFAPGDTVRTITLTHAATAVAQVAITYPNVEGGFTDSSPRTILIELGNGTDWTEFKYVADGTRYATGETRVYP